MLDGLVDLELTTLSPSRILHFASTSLWLVARANIFFARLVTTEERERAWAKWEDEFISQKYALPPFRSAIQFCNNDDSSLRMQMMMSVALAKKNRGLLYNSGEGHVSGFYFCAGMYEDVGGGRRS